MQETASAADRIVDALDMAADDAKRLAAEHPAPRNVLLRGLSGPAYVLHAIAEVRASDLEATLTTLPYPDALKLLEMAPGWLPDASQMELAARVAVTLVTAHQARLRASPDSRPLLVALQRQLRARVQAARNVMGFNLAGLRHIQRQAQVAAGDDAALPVKRKAMGAA